MSASTALAADSGTIFSHVQGLRDYWAMMTGQGPRLPAMQSRILLDMLGLGLEQTVMFVGRERPDFPDFRSWILATAGLPDPDALARYTAWLEGVPMPEATATRLRAIEEMPPVLDADDLAHWDEHGYVILRQAISLEEARAAEALLWRVEGADPANPATWYGPRNNGIMVQVFQDPALEPARRSPRVHKAFAQLWGTSDLWATVDRMSFNAPERPNRPFQGPGLHWDVSLTLPIPFAIQGLVYFTDTSADQGAFRLVPGFHHRLESWMEGLGDVDPRSVNLDAEAKPIAANAGDLILWRQDLPHGASPNRTDRPRMVQYVTMYSPDYRSQPVWK